MRSRSLCRKEFHQKMILCLQRWIHQRVREVLIISPLVNGKEINHMIWMWKEMLLEQAPLTNSQMFWDWLMFKVKVGKTLKIKVITRKGKKPLICRMNQIMLMIHLNSQKNLHCIGENKCVCVVCISPNEHPHGNCIATIKERAQFCQKVFSQRSEERRSTQTFFLRANQKLGEEESSAMKLTAMNKNINVIQHGKVYLKTQDFMKLLLRRN